MLTRYLVRFDDICPTMNWTVWRQVEEALVEEGVEPILAVVPDNRDPNLTFDWPEPRFWDRVRQWQARGWTIGMHGYHHRYETEDAGIVGRNRYSEFAGLSRGRVRVLGFFPTVHLSQPSMRFGFSRVGKQWFHDTP